jgi:hypothetical protein
MTRAEAEALCERHAAEHPDRERAQWRPRPEPDGSWSVVRVALPPGERGTEELEAAERPPTPDDPRSSAMRDIGPNVGPFV